MILLLLKVEKKKIQQNPNNSTLAVDIKWLRFIVYGYAFGCMCGIFSTLTNILNLPSFKVINLVSVTYFFLFFFAIFYDTITHKVYDEETKQKATVLPNEDLQNLMKRIDSIVRNKELFLEQDLSLQQIAKALNEKDRNVSNAINSIKQKNVNDYINTLRVEYACNLLIRNTEKPVFEVMYESGFSTKGAFNLAFKKITGVTPTKYREENSL